MSFIVMIFEEESAGIILPGFRLMFVSLFTQQLLIEPLLCARYFLGTKETAVNKMNEVPALLGVTFQFEATTKTYM